MKIQPASRTRLLLAGIALSMPLALLAEPMAMPPGGRHQGMNGMSGMYGATGHPPMCGYDAPFDGGMEPVPPFLRGMNLDEAQRDKIFQIMYAQMPQMREQEKARAKARQALVELGMSGQYSDAKAKALADTLARATAEIALLHARSDSQLIALLNPEQRASVDKTRKEMGAMPPAPPCHGLRG